MPLLDVLGGLLTTPGLLYPFHYPEVLLSALIAYAKREPVRVATAVLTVALVAASVLTGTPVAVLIGQVVAAVAVLEKVRASVAPLVSVLVHEADLEEGEEPIIVPSDVLPDGPFDVEVSPSASDPAE